MQVVTSYEPFSLQPEYIEANREFLRNLPLDSVRRVLDLACGTGTLTELLLELQPQVTVIGLDISKESLDIGRKQFGDRHLLVEDLTALDLALASGKGSVMLMEGTADEIFLEPDSIDLVLMGNAIHLLPDKDKLLAEVNRVLRPGGMFAFNSCFFVGTYLPGTEEVYTEWVKESMVVLQQKDEALRRTSGRGIPRQRGKGGRAFNKGWMSANQWREMLENNGLKVVGEEKRTVMMTQQSLEAIGAYAGFAKVMMSGYPVDIASECLQVGAELAMKKLGIAEVPRYWLEMIAVK